MLTGRTAALHRADQLPIVLAQLLDATRPMPPPAPPLVRVAGPRRRLQRGAVKLRPYDALHRHRARAAAWFVEAVGAMREDDLLEPVLPSIPALVRRAHPVVDPAGHVRRHKATLIWMPPLLGGDRVPALRRRDLAGSTRRLTRLFVSGSAGALVATAGDRVAGIAALGEVADGRAEVSLLVEDGRQRQGIGTRLLGAAARLGAAQGAEDVVLRGPADSPAAVAMVFGSGLRARVKLSGDELLVTVSTRGLAPLTAVAPAGVCSPTPAPV